MNKSQIFKKIKQYLGEGKSRETIYSELSSSCPNQSQLLNWIAMFPTEENKVKYKKLNSALFALLVLATIFKVIYALSIPLVSQSPVLLFIILLINIWMAVGVWKMWGTIYNFVTLFGIISVFKLLEDLFTKNYSWSVLFNVLFSLLIAGFGYYTGKKIVPNHGFFGHRAS